MNENIENVSLDDVTLEDIEAVANGTAVEAVAEDAPVDTVTEAESTETVAESTETVAEDASETAPVAAASAPTPVRKVGRPFDTSGTTKLGKARLLFAANPGMSRGELKTLFVNQLGIKEQTAETYASMVRRK